MDQDAHTNGGLDYPGLPPAQPVGIYGWRKRCVYAVLLILGVLVVCNTALTVWMLRVMDMSIDGNLGLKRVPGGFQLDGEAEFTRPVYVDTVKTKKGHPLYVQSSESVELLASDWVTNSTSSLRVDSQGIEATCDTFSVTDSKGRPQLTVRDGQVMVTAGDVVTTGPMTFSASIATPKLMSPMDEPLKILSPNGSINVFGIGVSIKTDVGDVEFNAQDSIQLISAKGGIHLKSDQIFLPMLQSSTAPSQAPGPQAKLPKVFQLCLCEDGKMFLAPSSGQCTGSTQICT